jgi:hypothetical protein
MRMRPRSRDARGDTRRRARDRGRDTARTNTLHWRADGSDAVDKMGHETWELRQSLTCFLETQ